jgi:hypothetical protein
MADQEIEITGIADAKAIQDDTLAQIVFATETGPIVCTFKPETLQSVIPTLCAMVQHFQAQALAKGGHFGLVAQAVAQMGASSPAGGGTVLLCIQSQAGWIQNFGLSPEKSAALRSEMKVSEATARNDAEKTRQ